MKTEICIDITVYVVSEGQALSCSRAKEVADKALGAAGYNPDNLCFNDSRRRDYDKVDVKYDGPWP